ncbi:MAG TPA: hypothetical protein ENF34_00415, partial [Candidatus Bathyarchaeota archaeon]|nr:hypothetical protein [Candidatus Bathyarchaeota archaeon]
PTPSGYLGLIRLPPEELKPTPAPPRPTPTPQPPPVPTAPPATSYPPRWPRHLHPPGLSRRGRHGLKQGPRP